MAKGTRSFIISCIVLIGHQLTTSGPQGIWKTCSTQTNSELVKNLQANECLPRPENVGVAHQKAVAYYESGCFDKEVAEFAERIKQEFADPAQHDKQLVIFDIDETVLSDYCNIKNIQFGHIPKLSHTWILQASAPAIPAMKDLYLYFINHGYRVIFLTGRKYNEYEATKKNLAKEGFISYDRLIVRSRETHHISVPHYKANERKKLTTEGYEIVACIGDQESDFEGGYTGKTFKVPAYMYTIT